LVQLVKELGSRAALHPSNRLERCAGCDLVGMDLDQLLLLGCPSSSRIGLSS
jgi:hypothetical protein